MASSKFSLSIKGLAALKRAGLQIIDTTNEESHDAAIQAAEKLAIQIQQTTPVITGDLKERVRWGGFKKRQGQPVAAWVGMSSKGKGRSNKPVLVEFGTVRAAPNPYFRPTVDANRKALIDAFVSDVKSGLQKL